MLSKDRLEKEITIAEGMIKGFETGLADEARPVIAQMEESLELHKMLLKNFQEALAKL